jgi:DHA2 family methylenomycin A resistance protein-like MFS transporter
MSVAPSAESESTGQRSGSPRAALIAAVIGFFVITLDAVVVNVALRQISIDMGVSMTGLQWIVDGYTLLFASCLLSAGAFSDRIGARRAYAIGMSVFVVMSLACGLAPTVAVLIVARVLQGTAAALMLPASMALIGENFPDPRKRARAVGIWSMGGALASISGPVVGGLLALVDWRMIFFINVPVGAVALVLVMRARKSGHRRVPLDWVGQITAVIALGALTYGTIEVGAAGIAAPQTYLAFIVAVIAAGVFIGSQHYGRHPILPLFLLRNRTLAVAIVVGFSYMVGYFGLPFVMNLYVQQERHLSTFESGLLFVPMMVAGAVLTPMIARMSERHGARALVVVGMVVLAGGLAILAVLPVSVPVWLLAVVMILVGIAGPLVIPTMTAVLLGAFEPSRAGTVSGVFNTSRQVGGALAVAVFGALLAGSSTFHPGFMLSLLIAAAIALIAAGVSALLPRH